MNKDKLGRQGGSGSQKRNHEGRQVWETSLGDKAAAAVKSEIMKGDKLGRQGGRPAWKTSRQRQPRAKS